MPLFSVVIPVYNRADRIMPTLQSVRNQTFDDWEAIVVDDGSRDGDLLQHNVATLGDGRFRLLRRENGGGSAARNSGIDAARGRYIAFLDSDDLYLPGRLEAAKEQFDRSADRDNLVVYSPFIVDRGIERKWVRPARGPLPGERIDEYLMCTDGNVQTSTVTLSAKVARLVRFDERLPSSQDTDFAVRCASAGTRFVFIPRPLVVFNDIHDLTRVSRQPELAPLVSWIESMRGRHISERAYRGYRGWHCARVASYRNRFKGLGFYLPSALRGVYAPMQAARIGAQVVVPQSLYQRLVQLVVKVAGKAR